MDGQKWWLESTTVQGALLTVVPTVVTVLHLFGVNIQDAEMQTIVTGIAGICGMFGAIIAIIGRFNAEKSISLTKPS